jgi:3-hydroxyisobutyrate dehydrogenase
MMLKDLRLAQDAARAGGATTPLGAEPQRSTVSMWDTAREAWDFSGINNFLRGA